MIQDESAVQRGLAIWLSDLAEWERPHCALLLLLCSTPHERGCLVEKQTTKLGHQIGDGLLEALGSCLRSCLRESDIVARLGGDEFVIGLQEVAGDPDIEEAVQKLLAALHQPFQIEGHELVVTSSIGIGKYPDDGESPGVLLRVADTRMYAAKSNLRGSYRFFSSELNLSTQRRILLVNDLHQACARGEFVLFYQP